MHRTAQESIDALINIKHGLPARCLYVLRYLAVLHTVFPTVNGFTDKQIALHCKLSINQVTGRLRNMLDMVDLKGNSASPIMITKKERCPETGRTVRFTGIVSMLPIIERYVKVEATEKAKEVYRNKKYLIECQRDTKGRFRSRNLQSPKSNQKSLFETETLD